MATEQNPMLTVADLEAEPKRPISFSHRLHLIREKHFRIAIERIERENRGWDKWFLRCAIGFFIVIVLVLSQLLGFVLLDWSKAAVLLMAPALLVTVMVFRLGRSHARRVRRERGGG
jgi:hypothetical protein